MEVMLGYKIITVDDFSIFIVIWFYYNYLSNNESLLCKTGVHTNTYYSLISVGFLS